MAYYFNRDEDFYEISNLIFSVTQIASAITLIYSIKKLQELIKRSQTTEMMVKEKLFLV